MKLWMAAGLILIAANAAHAEPFIEGTHFQRLPVPVETQSGDRVEVVEVFSYGCIHCYHFEPVVRAWRTRLDDAVAFRRVPAVFNATWKLLAQAYYTAEVLEVTDLVHQPIFDAIHREGVDVRDPDLLAAIFQKAAGVTPEAFSDVFGSYTVRIRVQQADAAARAYRVTGVPTMIVNGKYRVDGQMAGDNVAMLKVVDYLVDVEKAAAASGASQPTP